MDDHITRSQHFTVKQNHFSLLSRVGNFQLAPLQTDMSEDVQIIKDENNVRTVAEYMFVRDTGTALK